MKRLHHNGVLVPAKYEGKNLAIRVGSVKVQLTAGQEEMALAWVKKIGMAYVEDQVFAKNFHQDFSKKLGRNVVDGAVDYSELLAVVEEERLYRANLTKDEKKERTARRKAQREANKAHYGYAYVDGVPMEVANYAVEPSSIFMGRGKHPLRGHWKEGPREQDVELNLSPDAPKPPGEWKATVWYPHTMWIARWRDKLTGKMKYVWFADSTILKQKKDIAKFEKARELRQNLGKVQNHIWENLDAGKPERRKTATVAFLIDRLKIRVGDEKDPDEADTVGASTLRPEHVRYNSDNTVTFNFLGKDFVRHIFRIELPDNIIKNLKEFANNAQSTLFDGIGSKHVSEFLEEVIPGLSAKVFRTCYASEAVETKLEKASVRRRDPEYKKKHVAKIANLEAAKVCNHRRTIPKRWQASLEKKKMRLKTLQQRAKEAQTKLRERGKKQKKTHRKRLNNHRKKLKAKTEKLKLDQQKLQGRRQQRKPTQSLKERIKRQRDAITQLKDKIQKLKTKRAEQKKKLKQLMANRQHRDSTAIEKQQLTIRIQEMTRDYNLSTSLKSYIDPRIYYAWGKQIDYDWKQYYPKTLQKKFSWVDIHKSKT